MSNTLDRRLADGEVILIDGGTGTELEARGVPMNDDVWCGVAVLEHQDVVREVHEAYIRAGAEVITADTFPSNRLALEPAGFGDRVAEINRRAVETARQARDAAAERPVLIAGSLSPYDALGSPREQPSSERVLECFREQVTVQAEAGVDLFALEMVADTHYGGPAVQAAVESGLPVWLGMTDWSGEGDWEQDRSLGDVLDRIIRPGVTAVTAMHTDIGDIQPALDQIVTRWSGVIGAYAHHGDWDPPNWTFKDITPDQYADAALTWVDRGAQIIGGCCGIRPQHIAALRERLPTHVPSDHRRDRA